MTIAYREDFSRRFFMTASSSLALLAQLGHTQILLSSNEENFDYSQFDDEDALHMLEEFRLDIGNEQTVDGTMAAIEGGGNTVSDKLTYAREQIRAAGQRGEEKWYFKWSDSDIESFDYSHIVRSGSSVPKETGDGTLSALQTSDIFIVDAKVIRRMTEANYFDLRIDEVLTNNPRTEGRVIFALRGAMIESAVPGESVSLKEVYPNHRDPRCVFIVWTRTDKPETDILVAFTGSTVPSERYLSLYQTFKSAKLKSSMMPQGLHIRQLGDMVRDEYTHVNTLRQASNSPVIRETTREGLQFELGKSTWDPAPNSGKRSRNVGAHIHCAYWDTRADFWKYSSAGCQVINGNVKDLNISGEIEEFYAALNLPEVYKIAEAQESTTHIRIPEKIGTHSSPKYGTKYPMVLLTGREARLHAQDASKVVMRRIRIGSKCRKNDKDHPIQKVQQMIGFAGNSVDGDFGPDSMMRLLNQQHNFVFDDTTPADGVVTPAYASEMGVALT